MLCSNNYYSSIIFHTISIHIVLAPQRAINFLGHIFGTRFGLCSFLSALFSLSPHLLCTHTQRHHDHIFVKQSVRNNVRPVTHKRNYVCTRKTFRFRSGLSPQIHDIYMLLAQRIYYKLSDAQSWLQILKIKAQSSGSVTNVYMNRLHSFGSVVFSRPEIGNPSGSMHMPRPLTNCKRS